ncbi:hypothetical protein [Gluconobacter wancherniae]|uniref:Lipoprotein n=1 Tax=Gluconobacter wancherniae NBRC 103581 TaxID=656744 RepID=A0A511B1L2_9PROT|nr:hypothetical protein [Gluconobacter wancherniae]MBF0853532.1 hypothetical protein [Gluconobacter wancherniae]GBD55722.1 hypothetical protein NBRC103581_00289 [Gluconobacter wancherniae NBRC 103581]GBR66250.1 hypothetical protein AA103581_2254 [Gluconobacter wancherniae NBRC 103581]GEK93371.1 hypothetical protein GWA01_11410 [Gluconobacter wancherniae NBRC 103581]
MKFASNIRQFALPSFIMLVVAACGSQEQSKPKDTQLLPIQSTANQCAKQIFAIGHTQVGQTNLFETPYNIKEHIAKSSNLSDRTWETIMLPSASIPADGSNKGAAWRACMAGKGFQL